MAHLRRRDIVRQHDGMECGVAALAMICRALGLKVPLRYLGQLCVPTTGGVSMKGIADAANDLGIKSLAGKLTLEELHSAPAPCILHWNQEHFVVLRSAGKKKWHIAVGDGEVDEERMRHAAELANIAPYINSLPLGYDTKIGRDGSGLSQGQKQRVLIARAIYKNPPFIFLDEATNALDAENERLIVENLAEFYRGRTVVVVAHRLSTVRNADQIIVLDRGRIAETGTHATLVAARGKYFQLISNQLELGS